MKTTAENLEEKFDNGEDVLDYFDSSTRMNFHERWKKHLASLEEKINVSYPDVLNTVSEIDLQRFLIAKAQELQSLYK